jgi:hypothetical protein
VTEKLMQIMFEIFETFHVWAHYTVIQPILALFGLGKRPAGHGVSIYQGYGPPHAVPSRAPVSPSLLVTSGIAGDVCDLNIATRIKETACCVATDY